MTYVADNVRFSLDDSSIKPLRRRSEGRLKAISSNEDFRSWNNTVDNRRRHILDVVKSDIEKCGQLTTAVLQALTMKSKEKLARSLKQLWAFIMSRDLTDKEKEHLINLQKQMGYACSQAISNCPCEGDYDLVCPCDDETGEMQKDRLLKVVQQFEGQSAPVQSSKGPERISCECTVCSKRARSKFVANASICGGQKASSPTKKKKTSKTADSSETPVTSKEKKYYNRKEVASSEGPRTTSSSKPDTFSETPASSKMKDRSSTDNTDPTIKGFTSTGDESQPISSSKYKNKEDTSDTPDNNRIMETTSDEDTDTNVKTSSRTSSPPMYTGYEDVPKSDKIKDKTSGDDTDEEITDFSSSTNDKSGPSPLESSDYKGESQKNKKYQELVDTLITEGRKEQPEDASRPQSVEKSEGPHIDTVEKVVSSTISTCSIDCQCRTEAKTVGLRTEPQEPLVTKREGSMQFECPCLNKSACTPIRPTRNVKLDTHITTDESSEQYKQLKSKYAELECLCKEQKQNIQNILKERDMLRQQNQKSNIIGGPMNLNEKNFTSPEIEAGVIKREVEILQQYCLKLKAAEEENELLKKEKNELKRQVRPKLRDSKASGVGVSEMDDGGTDCESCIKLKAKIKMLERRLSLCTSAKPADFEIFKGQSSVLDNALAERDQMQNKIGRIHELESQLNEYKKKAARADELEDQLRRLHMERSSNYDVRKVQSKCVCVQRKLDNVKAERNAIQQRMELMKEEMERLRVKAKEAEVLLVERDQLQIKLNNLSHVQVHNENLRLKCKCLENAANERDMYKQKYEELLNLENEGETETSSKLKREKELLRKQIEDLQSCIVEQECEIKRLTEQIDSLNRNKGELQERMKNTLLNMRSEIEKKDRLIEIADQKLEKVQAQFRSSIQGVTAETSVYKTRIQELEIELNHAKNHIQKLDASLSRHDTRRNKTCELVAVCAMKKELQTANAENRKLQNIAENMAKLTGNQNNQKQSEEQFQRYGRTPSSSKHSDEINNRLKEDSSAQTPRKCQGQLAARMMEFRRQKSREK